MRHQPVPSMRPAGLTSESLVIRQSGPIGCASSSNLPRSWPLRDTNASAAMSSSGHVFLAFSPASISLRTGCSSSGPGGTKRARRAITRPLGRPAAGPRHTAVPSTSRPARRRRQSLSARVATTLRSCSTRPKISMRLVARSTPFSSSAPDVARRRVRRSAQAAFGDSPSRTARATRRDRDRRSGRAPTRPGRSGVAPRTAAGPSSEQRAIELRRCPCRAARCAMTRSSPR